MRYWDVFPKYIRMTKPLNPEGFLPVPISVRGTPLGMPIFEVSNPEVATVDADGNVMPGPSTGSTTIMVYDEPEKKSVRHVQVQVLKAPSVAP